jgi:hypothetical protein
VVERVNLSLNSAAQVSELDKRITELCALIVTEQNAHKFLKLVTELNGCLEVEKDKKIEKSA